MKKKFKKIKKYTSKKKFKHKIKFRNRKEINDKPKLLIKISLILFLIILYAFSFKNNNDDIQKDQSKILEELISFENSLNLNEEVFNEFRKINSENKLIEENPNFKRSKNPDVSVLMIIHNQAYYLHKGLRSIQNQSLKNIEIIIIDDCSEDNSIDLIKNYQKEDERIILISHDSNEGKIKSRADGVRIAKGKYIALIDGDDALIHKDIIKNSLYIAQKGNLDCVQFLINYYRYGKFEEIVTEFNFTNNSYIITQPELSNKYFGPYRDLKYLLKNRNIYSKFIKNELFQKMLDFIGPQYTDDYINIAEDTIMAVALYHLANSFYCMRESGYFYSYGEENRVIKNNNRKCKPNDKLKDFSTFKYIKFLVDKSSNNEKEKNNIYDELFFLGHTNYLRNDYKLEKRHYQILFFIYDKMLEWSELSKEKHHYIENLRNKTLEKKIKDNTD